MNPGAYRERITFVTVIENDDGIGGGSVTYSSLITVWASVVPFNSNQTLAYGELFTAQGYNIECRVLKTYTITTNHGITWNSKNLIIHSCVEEGLKRLKIIAFEQ